ncbi:MAG TPA: shikimate dehydrogenase [Steroidobacteraceae bacterium]|nr:shikimate dehydrogenase [Steroidobacteraceae bacterium]
MSQPLDQYGVIGHPVTHSWSPFIHAMFARQTGQELAYRLYDAAPEQFEQRVHDFAAQGGRGLNVTLPHKPAAASLASQLTPRAERAGAVNTLTFNEGRIFGDNTDGVGLVRDLCTNLGLRLAARRILIVGAGGATRGVIEPLLMLRPAELAIAGRSADRPVALAAAFTELGQVHGCALEDLSPDAFDLVINATSASLHGEVPAIPVAAIGASSTCYDMAYAKTDTPFVRWARERGCALAVQGWGMLVEQAAESFQVWRGMRPKTAPVIALLSQAPAG